MKKCDKGLKKQKLDLPMKFNNHATKIVFVVFLLCKLAIT